MTVIVYMHACYCSIHIQMIFSILPNPFMKSHLEGSQTTIYCAVSEEMEGVSGKYLSDCRDQGIQTTATSDEDLERFWKLSYQLADIEE